MKKNVILALVFLCSQCRTPSYLRPANEPDLIKDSFYYCRDTINFYQVEMSENLILSIDSLINNPNRPLQSKYNYWTIQIVEKTFGSFIGILSQDHCEEFFIIVESTKTVYKAINIGGKSVLIIDPYDVFKPIPEKPFIKISNPRKLKAIYQQSGGHGWLFKLDRNGELSSLEEY